MKYTTYNVQQIVREGRKGKPWQARAKYKDKLFDRIKMKKQFERMVQNEEKCFAIVVFSPCRCRMVS